MMESSLEYALHTPSVEEAATSSNDLYKLFQKVMRYRIDYDKMPGASKPILLKPGAEKLLNYFGLGQKLSCAGKEEDWENGFFYYNYKVSIIRVYPAYELTVAECEGSANSKEKRYRNQDVYSIVNTLQKMAIKRALVGATLQATGASGLFAQGMNLSEPNPPNG